MRLPGPLRAAIGLAATASDEARKLPERALELPMLAVSSALQMSLRAQQRYARLTARGDEVLRGQPSDDPPAWATFDDPVAASDLHDTAFDRMDGQALPDLRSFADLFAVADPDEPEPPVADRADNSAGKPPARKAAARKTPAKKSPAKTPVKPAAKQAAAGTPAKKTAATKSPAKKAGRGDAGS